LKALPLTYNRDLQLDKPVLFRSVETAKEMLEVMAALFGNLKVKKASVETRLANDESFYSVDVMEYLIKKGVSYREAHDIVGKMVKECLDEGLRLSELTAVQLNGYSQYLDTDVKKLFNPQMSVKIKSSLGSTNAGLVDQQLKLWQKKLKG
jgi:argininosuccinate lyase